MSKSVNCPTPIRPSLNLHLYEKGNIGDDLRHLIVNIARGTKYISYAIQTTETGLSGNTNLSGDDQLKLDVVSDDILRQHLCEGNLVCCYASEEQDSIVELSSDASFSVVFDPLDGSSLVDANFSIGSIFGIYEGKEIIGKTPRQQVTAFYVLYGPRTILVYSTGNGVHEFILNDVGEFILLREFLGVSDEAKNYSPGNLRALSDNKNYDEVLKNWLSRSLTLRYSGCMVADIHHILSKGQGIFTNIGGNKYPEGKLRLSFECGPFAYLMEQAGGSASDGTVSILDKEITDIHQRTAFIAGSKTEVQHIVSVLS